MMKIDACLSHQSDDWKTPTWLYNKFIELNYIDCFKYKSEINELNNTYKNKKLFINPPFPTILMLFRPNINPLKFTVYQGMTQEELKEYLTK